MRKRSDRLSVDPNQQKLGCSTYGISCISYGTHEKEVIQSAISFSAISLGLSVGTVATVDPFDQLGSAPQNSMGCDGILVGKLSQTQTMGLAQASIVDRFSHVGCCHRGRDVSSVD